MQKFLRDSKVLEVVLTILTTVLIVLIVPKDMMKTWKWRIVQIHYSSWSYSLSLKHIHKIRFQI